MFLHTLSTTVPEAAFTQRECAELVQASRLRERLGRRSMLTLLAILRGDSGVAKRHFAVQDIDRIFDMSADELNAAFRREAPALAKRALQRALDEARVRPRDLDALLVCTCTGYLCPGVTSYVAEDLGLRPDAQLQDLVGLGCGAAIPMLRSADAILARHPDATIATVAVEICSAAFYIDDDPGVLISACLFGDGAAAAVWRGAPPADRPALRCHQFNTLHQPQHRDRIRFEQRNGRLRNLLDLGLPAFAAGAVSQLWHDDASGARPATRILSHGGGRDILDALQGVLPGHDLTPARDVLRDFGNMSSPSVLFALDHALRASHPADDEDWWLVSFGAGFSAHTCRLGTPTVPRRRLRQRPASYLVAQ